MSAPDWYDTCDNCGAEVGEDNIYPMRVHTGGGPRHVGCIGASWRTPRRTTIGVCETCLTCADTLGLNLAYPIITESASAIRASAILRGSKP